jgi:hypothetical protein
VNALWSYFWPVFAVGLLAGAIAGSIAFRLPRMRSKDRIAGAPAVIRDWRRKRVIALGLGIAVSVAAAALWHGPLGAADRFASEVERGARQTLDAFEMTRVQAQLHHRPLTRRIRLSGPADDFQRSELVRIIGDVPGVSSARWSASGGGLPLIVEGAAAAGLGFLFGLLLAYLVELRRRYNAQWTW